MFERIPKELKEEGLFCLYKMEQRKGKTTKVPYQVNGCRADPSNRKCFTDFETVKATQQKGGYAGLSIGVFEPYAMIDIDHCVENGKLSSMAQEIVELMDSYTEYSPSGTGIHIIAKINKFKFDATQYYINNRKLGLEVYVAGTTNKYLTITGNVICDKAPQYRDAELAQLVTGYMKRSTVENKNEVVAPGSFLSDESVIQKIMASKQADKFKPLWEGEIPEGKSHSEADMTLVQMLAFWCGGDAEQIDRLFRQSGLMRNKWDEMRGSDTYGAITIKNAVRNAKEFYHPLGIGLADVDFNDLLILLKELKPESNGRYKGGDLGSGRLFADVFRDIARYVPERKKWYVYDGIRWIPDVGALKVMELSKDLADALTMYATTIKNEAVRTYFMDVCKRWQQRKQRETYLKEAQSVYPVSMEKFDANRYLFNCKNGTMNLKTHEFREHRAEDYITKLAPVNYVPDAKNIRFETFIDEITSGDKEKAKFLQKALGYSVSGDTRYECMFLLYGETTRNGKGTLMESVLSVMGDYGRAVRPETIAVKSNNSSQNPTEDIARLAGIRFANISEPSRGLLLNAAQVKSMTGNDTLNARFLHENSFDFKPQFKLYVNTNYLPVINDMTLFSSGRVIIVPFDRHFEEWEQDRTLKAEFAKDEAQSAILNWLMEGYYLLRKEGLKQPQSVIEATATYYHESDKVQQFAEDKLCEDTSAEVRTSVVYDRYKQWCVENGCYAENSRNFNQELRKFGTVVRRRPQTGGEKTTLLLGYRLKDVEEEFL